MKRRWREIIVFFALLVMTTGISLYFAGLSKEAVIITLLVDILTAAGMLYLTSSNHGEDLVQAKKSLDLILQDEESLRQTTSQIQKTLTSVNSNQKRFDENLELLSGLIGSIADIGDFKLLFANEHLKMHARDIVANLKQLSRGEIKLQHHSPQHMWGTHMKHLSLCKHGTRFFATCYIPKDEQEAEALLSHDIFNEYCRLSYQLTKESVLYEFKKVFLIPTKMLQNSKLYAHLCEIDRQKKDSAMGNRLDFRILTIESFHELYPDKSIEDFMLFDGGEATLFLSYLDTTTSIVSGVHLFSDGGTIKDKIRLFSAYYNRAIPFEDFLTKRHV